MKDYAEILTLDFLHLQYLTFVNFSNQFGVAKLTA